MRRLLCLSLAFFLFLSVPLSVQATEATTETLPPILDITNTATPVAVDADNAVAAALIGLGVQPGTSQNDFNMVVSSCVTALTEDGVFTDGKYAVLVNQEDGVSSMYAPISLIDNVESWLLGDSGVLVSLDYPCDGSFDFMWDGSNYYVQIKDDTAYCFAVRYWLSNGNYSNYLYIVSSGSVSYRSSKDNSEFGDWLTTSKPSGGTSYLGPITYSVVYSASEEYILDVSGIPYVDLGTFESYKDAKLYVSKMQLSGLGYTSYLDLSVNGYTEDSFSSWADSVVTYNGVYFLPMAAQTSYDQTIQTPQAYVQGGITDYEIPTVPEATNPPSSWPAPEVPVYPGEGTTTDNEFLYYIKIAVTETIPYYIQNVGSSIVQWLEKIHDNITNSISGVVGVISANYQAMIAKLDELKAGFGGDSSAGDDLQGEVDRQDQELDDMTDIMDSVTKPDIEEIDPDLTDEVDQEKLTLFTSPFVTMMTEGPFATMFIMTLTLVLCSYILYGKR